MNGTRKVKNKSMKNRLLILGLVVILAMMILPVSAAKTSVFKANGKVTNYSGWNPPDPNTVVGGTWNIRITNYDDYAHTGNVDFKLMYKEVNLSPGENAPYGSVDHFWITLVEAYWVDVPNGCVSGKFDTYKLAVQPDGTKVMKHNPFGDVYGAVWFTSTGLVFDAWPWTITQDWSSQLIGTITMK